MRGWGGVGGCEGTRTISINHKKKEKEKKWDWTRASVSKETADSSLLSNKMAEDVNNDATYSKTEERKIVVEFCQLQEKSRQLFNSLRCDSYLRLFLLPVFTWSWNISKYAELRVCCYSSVGWAQQRVTVCVLSNRGVCILSAPLIFFVFPNWATRSYRWIKANFCHNGLLWTPPPLPPRCNHVFCLVYYICKEDLHEMIFSSVEKISTEGIR